MATDFKYVPLQPDPISGQSVLEQTEMAINELGGQVEDSAQLAQEALDMANSANTTANEALTEAQGASTAAQSAQTTADTALSTAQSAQSDASQALTTANQALDASAIAEGDSGNALTTANQALTTANAAQATATTADQNASSAVSTAQSASIMSAIAMGIFQVTPDPIDANQKYSGAEKLFLTGTGNTNFPTDITFPAWLMVYINSDGTSVTHTCWDDNDTARIYTRTATINNSDPQNPVVTWSPWQSVATPNNLESVDVQVDPAGQPAGTYLVFVYSTTSGTDTLYINLSQLVPVYTPGNGAIAISNDYKISLQLDPSQSQGLIVSSSGLQTTPQTISLSDNQESNILPDISIGTVQSKVQSLRDNAKYLLSRTNWLISSVTIYVRTDGDDNNTGTSNTPQGALKTMGGVVKELRKINTNNNVTVNFQEGEFTSNVALEGSLFISSGGRSSLIITGVPGSTFFSGITNIYASTRSIYFRNITFSSVTVRASYVDFSGCSFSGASGRHGLAVIKGSNVTISDSISFSGTGNSGIYVHSGGFVSTIDSQNIPITFASGTTFVNAFLIVGESSGTIYFNGNPVYTGSFTGQKYNIACGFSGSSKSMLDAIPGSSEGVVRNSGGLYASGNFISTVLNTPIQTGYLLNDYTDIANRMVFASADISDNGTIRKGINISSVSRNSTGVYTITFSTNAPDGYYTVFIGGFALRGSVLSKSISSVQVQIRNNAGEVANSNFDIIVFI